MPPGGLNIRWPDHAARAGGAAAPLQAGGGASRSPAPTGSTASCWTRQRRASASSPPANPISTSARRWTISASAPPRHARSGCASTRWRCPGRSSPRGVRRFAEGLQEVLVVEEKRAVIETQLKEQLYNWPADRRPRIIGKFDEAGKVDPAVERRAGAGPDRAGHRRAPCRPWRYAVARRTRRPSRCQGAPFGWPQWRRHRAVPAHAVFLLGLPAQHLDPGAGRQPRARRHRLPLPVAVHGPRDRHLHPDGRRRRRRGSGRRRSPRRATSSPISATAPTPIRASWRSAPRSPPKST